MKQGYLQVPLHPGSKHLTVFESSVGLCNFNCMPFGQAGAPQFVNYDKDQLKVVVGYGSSSMAYITKMAYRSPRRICCSLGNNLF